MNDTVTTVTTREQQAADEEADHQARSLVGLRASSSASPTRLTQTSSSTSSDAREDVEPPGRVHVAAAVGPARAAGGVRDERPERRLLRLHRAEPEERDGGDDDDRLPDERGARDDQRAARIRDEVAQDDPRPGCARCVRRLDELARAQRDDAASHDARDARPEIDHQPEPEFERRHGPAEDDDDEQERDGGHRDDRAGQPGDERVEDTAVVARRARRRLRR